MKTTDTEKLRELSFEHPIVFFDGVCGLCNGVVDWLIERDRHGYFRFAPLQGAAAEASLTSEDIQNLNSIVFMKDAILHRKSNAALYILKGVGGWYAFAATLLGLFPRALRDLIYDSIARHRYGWFGQRETCRLPTSEERVRFLE